MDEAQKLFEEIQKESEKSEITNDKNEIKENFSMDEEQAFNNFMSPSDMNEMLKFYMYLQNVLNSKQESSEKKMVKTFLRKTIQKMKDNEKQKNKEPIENIIKNTEGHQGMIEKLADIMKIDKEKLKEEEVKNKLDQILIGMLKFIDYTNNSNVIGKLLDEIEIKEIEQNDGTKKPKFQVNINNSKTHMEMLQKASNFMGLEINQEELQKLTSGNKWYENFLNNVLNNSDEL